MIPPRQFAIQRGSYSDYDFYDVITGDIFTRLNDRGEEFFSGNFFETKLSGTLHELIMEFKFDEPYDFNLIWNWKLRETRREKLESLL